MSHRLSCNRNHSQNATTTDLSLAKSVLIAAVWFGLAVGLVEGVGLWVLQQLSWLSGSLKLLGSSIEIIWIAPLFDLLLFGLVGIVLGLIAWRLPRRPILMLSMFVLVAMALFDWAALLLSGRVSIYAIFVLAMGLAIELARWLSRYWDGMVRFSRRSLPWVAAVALLGLVVIQGGLWLQERMAIAGLPEAAPGSPNILVIVVDTLRADHLSSYGYDRPTSPNVDRLTQDGVLFENAFATSSWTQPSHASFLTGRYTYEHGADAFQPLDDRYPTIGEALQARGYRTGTFSANVKVFNQRLGFGRGFHLFEDYYRSIGSLAISTVYGRAVEVYVVHRGLGVDDDIGRRLAHDINRAALRWIDRDPESPFFVFLNYFDVHDPYLPPQPYRRMFSEFEEPGGLINSYWDTSRIYIPMTSEQLQGEIDAYDGGIAYTDEHIHQLLAELEHRGLVENTLVVITSDHGESFGEHGLMQHTNALYREVIHVPLIFWWPGHIPAGERVAEPVSIAALPATLMDLIDEEEQTLFPGPSVAQLWEDPSLDQEWPYPMAELAQISWSPVENPSAHGAMKSVLNSQWQYIEHKEFGSEFYNWQNDPAEMQNLAETPEVQGVVNRFKTYLETLVASATHLSE